MEAERSKKRFVKERCEMQYDEKRVNRERGRAEDTLPIERPKRPDNPKRPFVLVAGGTGGHVFPAVSVALLLQKMGRKVIFVTDERAQAWVQGVDRCYVFPLRNSTSSNKMASSRLGSVMTRGMFFLRLAWSGLRSLALFVRHRPAIVVGFGGYPSAPPVLAAQLLRIPTLLHECNSLLGRANALLKPLAKGFTSGFPHVLTPGGKEVAGFSFVGNPLRENLDRLSRRPYTLPSTLPSDKVRLFVTGGSQGSDFLAWLVPEALRLLPDEVRERFDVTQQVREKELSRVEQVYSEMGVSCEVRPFFADMETPLRRTHLMISRSGALTLSEIAAAGLPSVLVPLASSRDGDQLHNALQFHRAGAAHFLEEGPQAPELLARMLEEVAKYPRVLESMSQAARSFYVPQATEHFVTAIFTCLDELHEAKLDELERREVRG